jgi:hypothetical protein
MKQLKAEMEAQKGVISFNEDEIRIETSKLVDSDIEQNNADVEISTLENSFNYMSDDDFISSDEESETQKGK